jgi:hypothetical protein
LPQKLSATSERGQKFVTKALKNAKLAVKELGEYFNILLAGYYQSKNLFSHIEYTDSIKESKPFPASKILHGLMCAVIDLLP